MITCNKIYLSVEDVKRHLNIDYNDDDVYIADLVKAAQGMIAMYINRDLSSLEDENGRLPETLKHALRLQVGNFYANRESVAYFNVTNVPFTLQALLRPWKNYKSEV